jgi:hypothetical protein
MPVILSLDCDVLYNGLKQCNTNCNWRHFSCNIEEDGWELGISSFVFVSLYFVLTSPESFNCSAITAAFYGLQFTLCFVKQKEGLRLLTMHGIACTRIILM